MDEARMDGGKEESLEVGEGEAGLCTLSRRLDRAQRSREGD